MEMFYRISQQIAHMRASRFFLFDFQSYRFVLLLAALAIYFLVSPFLMSVPVLGYVVGVFLTLVLVSSLYIMEHEKKLLVISGVLLFMALLGNWAMVSSVSRSIGIQVFVYIISILFFSMITFFVIRYVLHHRTITVNSLCGALCGYLCMALVWSYIYRVLVILFPHSFSGMNFATLSPDELEQHFTYYSFVTITTLGYGDITPKSDVAEMLSWLEALTGQIFLTVWMARLVSLHISDNQKNNMQSSN